MISPQESRFAKITGVIAIVIAFLAWVHPFAPRSNVLGTERTATSSEPSAKPPGPQPDKPPVDLPNPGRPGEVVVDLTSEGEGGTRPRTGRPNPEKPTSSCDVPETASLRPGAPVQVASGLVALSVKAAREGSEPYLTLGIVSDRDTLTKAVLGAPVRYNFATSRGAYFVNVTDIDLKDGVMTVQVGCEAKESTP